MQHTRSAFQGGQTIIQDNLTSTFMITEIRCDSLIHCSDESKPHSSLTQIPWSNIYLSKITEISKE